MAAGISNPVMGYIAFSTVKFAGYSLAAALISHIYRERRHSAFLVGGTRTLIGINLVPESALVLDEVSVG